MIDFRLLWVFIASQAFSSSVEQGLPSSCSVGFSLQWLILLQSTGSELVTHRLVTPQQVGSSRAQDRTCVPCTGRQILNHWVTRTPSGPLLTPRVVSSDSPNTTALPPWTLYSVPQPTLVLPFPLRHPAPVYSSPAPWRVPSCLISDCEPALLLQWLQTCKLICHPPSATIPSSVRSEPQPQREGSAAKLILTLKLVLSNS